MTLARTVIAALLGSAVAACGASSTETAKPVTPKPAPTAAPTPGPAATKPTPPPAAPALRLPDDVVPLEYNLALSIDPTKRTFSGTTQIKIDLRKPSDHVWLHATELDIKSAFVKVGPQRLPIERLSTSNDDFLGFRFPRQLGAGQVWLEISYTAKLSATDYSGLFRQEDDGNWYAFTQFESTSARRAFPCFDEPRFKVPWRVTLEVPAGLVAASNAPVLETETKGATKIMRFAATKPIPSYLVAFAVGPFDVVDGGTAGRNKTPVRFLVLKGKAERTKFAVQMTPKLVRALETYFDSPYPYAKLDSVSVPRFFGAMENPGLITYASSLLVAPPGKLTRSFKKAYSAVGAHELAHQWFGNLVTLAWWDDIWLNESFATWMGMKVVHRLHPEWEFDVAAVGRRDNTMKSDSLITARKIRQPIKTKDDIGAAFDSISYGKGGAVLHMFEAWIGDKDFQRGVRAYMKKHAWGNATAAHFLAEIAKVSKPELAVAFRTFLDQPGLPLLSATLSCGTGKPKVAIAQQRFLPMGSKGSTDMTWKLPVCVKWRAGKKQATKCALISSKTAEIELDAPRCPDWINANAGANGYYRVAYQPKQLKKLLTSGRKYLSVAERVEVISGMGALVSAGKMGIGDALSMVPMLTREKHPVINHAVVDIATSVNPRMFSNKLRGNYARFIRKNFGRQARRLGWKPRKGEGQHARSVRATLVPLVAGAGRDKKLRRQATRMTRRWLKTGKGIDRDLLGAVLAAAARDGNMKLHAQMTRALTAAKLISKKRAIVHGLARFTSKRSMDENFKLFLGKTLDIRAAGGLLQAPLVNPETQLYAFELFKNNYSAIETKLPRFARSFLMRTIAVFCDKGRLAAAKPFFASKAPGYPGGAKALAQGEEAAGLCIAFREANQANIAAFLKRY